MNTAQNLAHPGGPALVEAMKFVTICRALDPQNDYPHLSGDILTTENYPTLFLDRSSRNLVIEHHNPKTGTKWANLENLRPISVKKAQSG